MEFIQTSRLQQNGAPQTSRQFIQTIRLHVSSSSKDKKSYVWFIQTFFSILLNKQKSRVVGILYRIEFTYTIRLHVSSSSKDKKSYIWFIQIFYSIEQTVEQYNRVEQCRREPLKTGELLYSTLYSMEQNRICWMLKENRRHYVLRFLVVLYSTLLYYSTLLLGC